MLLESARFAWGILLGTLAIFFAAYNFGIMFNKWKGSQVIVVGSLMGLAAFFQINRLIVWDGWNVGRYLLWAVFLFTLSFDFIISCFTIVSMLRNIGKSAK